MKANSTVIYDEAGSYMVISDTILPEPYTNYTFIVYMEGIPKGLLRLFKEHRKLFSDRILYCIKDTNFFINHCKEIEEGLYEYTGKL
jgi:hypothetical protein